MKDQLWTDIQTWMDTGTPVDIGAAFNDLGDDFNARIQEFMIRDAFVRAFGFSVPTPTFAAQVTRFGPVVELAAGSGFLSKIVAHTGPIIPTDPEPWAPGVIKMDGQTAAALWPDRTILVSWPGLDTSWLNDVLKDCAPGRVVMIVGEDEGGCTGDDGLWDVLDTFEELTTPEDTRAVWSFSAIHDRLRVWRKKG